MGNGQGKTAEVPEQIDEQQSIHATRNARYLPRPTSTLVRGATPHLLSLAWAREWPEVLVRCSTHPEEAYHTNSFGRTPLHLAMFSRDGCRPIVLIALLKANRHAAIKRDKIGFTPLHYACQFGNGNEDLLLLLTGAAVTVDLENLDGVVPYSLCNCHHSCACQDCPSLFQQQQQQQQRDDADNDLQQTVTTENLPIPSPLYLACRRNAPKEVICVLLQQSRRYTARLHRLCRRPPIPNHKKTCHCDWDPNYHSWIAPFTGGEPWYFFSSSPCCCYNSLTERTNNNRRSSPAEGPFIQFIPQSATSERNTIDSSLPSSTATITIDNVTDRSLCSLCVGAHNNELHSPLEALWEHSPPDHEEMASIISEYISDKSASNFSYRDDDLHLPVTEEKYEDAFQQISMTDDCSVTVPSIASSISSRQDFFLRVDSSSNLEQDDNESVSLQYIEFWEKVLLHLRVGTMPRSPSCSKFPSLDQPLRDGFQFSENNRLRSSAESTVMNMNDFPLLHVVSALKRPLPSLVSFVLLLHPEQISCLDNNGYTPLHHAILSHDRQHCNSNAEGLVQVETQQQRHSLLVELLRACPECAQIPSKNKSSMLKLPITMALEYSITWDTGIKELLRAFPDALSCRDKSSSFFPFMTAAVSNTNTLTTVYELLRCFPDMVSC